MEMSSAQRPSVIGDESIMYSERNVKRGTVTFSVTMLGTMLGTVILMLTACSPGERQTSSEGRIPVVATTTIVADLVREVGGERVQVTALMGPGVDPHLYKASEGDVQRMAGAQAVFYNGLHLEGKITDVLDGMRRRGLVTVAVAECVDPAQRLEVEDDGYNFDPHIWFDVELWKSAARCAADALVALDSAHADDYRGNADRYLVRLDSLNEYVRTRVAELPEEKRVLITAHDAFGYFGRAYGFEVHGLLGVSTAAEAGTGDIQRLADFIVSRRIPAVFVETSVPARYLEAMREAVSSRGFSVSIGGSLYSDALGEIGTPAGTYVGMVGENIATVVEGLKGQETEAR